jgi:hypothetical protein
MDPIAKPVPVDEELDQDIEVPDDGSTPPADKEVDLDEEDAKVADFKKLDQQAFYALRKEAAEAKKEREELRKRVADYEKQAKAPVPQPAPVVDTTRRREMIGGIPVPETKAEWDALARSDWQAAVDLRSIIKAREVTGEVRKAELAARTLDESKNKVLQRHPELADAQTEKGKIYLEILDRNPEYLTMSKGPILAMRDMEDEMESRGFTKDQIFDSKKAAAQSDATRVSRGALTAAGRMPEKSARTVTLSKDDLEFCKSQGIDPKDYAKERLNLENNRKGAQL